MRNLILAAAMGLCTTVACAKNDSPSTGAEVVARPVGHVQVGLAHFEPFAVTYRVSGTVRGRRTTVLSSKTMGYVRAIRVRPGDSVRRGQTLVELEANDTRARVAGARAQLEQSAESKTEAENGLQAAQSAAHIANASYDRMKTLLARDAVSQQQFDEADASRNSAEAQARAAEARVRSVGSRIAEAEAAVGEASAALAYADIVAPFDGRVIERQVDPGALAGPGTPLLVIADEGKLRVEAAVEESRAADINLGDQADVQLDSAPHPLAASVVEIVPSIDTTSRALLVKLDLPPDAGSFRAGSFARVEFKLGTSARLVVRASAVSSLGALDRVFVAQANRAHLRLVTLGETRGDWTEVLSGLSVGERIVTAPPPGLRDGDAIQEQS